MPNTPKTETAESKLNKGREIIQSFIDDLAADLCKGDDTMLGLVATRLWAIHDEGYNKALQDNGMAP